MPIQANPQNIPPDRRPPYIWPPDDHPPGSPLEDDRLERFCECVALGHSYKRASMLAFPDLSRLSASQRSQRLRQVLAINRRIEHLRETHAAARALATIGATHPARYKQGTPKPKPPQIEPQAQDATNPSHQPQTTGEQPDQPQPIEATEQQPEPPDQTQDQSQDEDRPTPRKKPRQFQYHNTGPNSQPPQDANAIPNPEDLSPQEYRAIVSSLARQGVPSALTAYLKLAQLDAEHNSQTADPAKVIEFLRGFGDLRSIVDRLNSIYGVDAVKVAVNGQ